MTFLEQQDRVLADLNDVDANYFTRTIVKGYLNEAQKTAQKVIEQAFEGHFQKCVETTTVIGQREYELPTDFKRLVRLELVISGSAFSSQTVQTLGKCTRSQQDVLPRSGTPAGYDFKGTQLILFPCPNVAKTLRMEYVYKLPTLSADGDTSEIPSEYHEYMCVLATIMGFLRDSVPTNELVAKKKEMEEDIKRDAEQRNIDQPRQVVQTNFDEPIDDVW